MLLHDIKEIRGGRCVTADGGPGSGIQGHTTAQQEEDRIYALKPKPLSKSLSGNLAARSEYDKKYAEWRRAYGVAVKANSTTDAVNHIGEKEYQTYAAWRAACKQANPNVQFEGDKDICQAKPGVGEWGGDKGVIYTKDSDESSESISPEEFLKGIEVEMEHNDITHGDPVTTAKIVLAHLKEMPDYYSRLEKMEGSATKDGGVGSGTKGHITPEQMKAMKAKATQNVERRNAVLKEKMKGLPKAEEIKTPKKGQEFNYEGNLATVTAIQGDTVHAAWHGWRGDRAMKFKIGEKPDPEQSGKLKPHTKISPRGNYMKEE